MTLTSLEEVTVLKACRHHFAATAGEELVLLHGASAEYFGLNDVGTKVWNWLGRERTVGELCELVAHEYQLPQERILEDLLPFLTELVATGLVEVVPT